MEANNPAPSKRRPSKGSNIQKRRERGRAAQAAFRQRQIDRINEQEAQLQAYNDAMRAIKRVCHTCKAALKMSAAIGSGNLPARVAAQLIEELEVAVELAPAVEDPDVKRFASTQIAARTDTRDSGHSRISTGIEMVADAGINQVPLSRA